MESHEELAVQSGATEDGIADTTTEQPASDASPANAEIELVRELVLRAHPDVVPELIAGQTVADLLAAVPAAQEAYRRAVEAARASNPPPEPVPAGGGRAGLDVESMSSALKIRMGLGTRS